MDPIDRKILSVLQEDGGASKAEIARRVSLAPSAVSERLKRLSASGALQGFDARLDPTALAKPLLAFVFVSDVKPSRGDPLSEALVGVTGLEELHKIAGEDCYLLKIRAAGTDALNEIIEREINPLANVSRVRTTIVLKRIVERPPLGGYDLSKT